MSNLSFEFIHAEQELTLQLEKIIRQEILVNNGVIPFSRYMDLALYYPGLGYYANSLVKFGAQGDFITAPHISSLFGHLLARQISELFAHQVAPQILEFGAGNGYLAIDILASIGEQIDTYYILELSADLIKQQRLRLTNKVPQFVNKVVWLDHLPLNFSGVMIANEVLDAQACNLVRFDRQSIIGVGVTVGDSGFNYTDYPLDKATLEVSQALNLDYVDYISEVNIISEGFIRSLADSLSNGALLLIDYGYPEAEYYHPTRNRGTLRGFCRHQLLDSVLVYPGLIDITSSVNWSSIAHTAINAGLELIGYTTQGHFLINCGLGQIMADLQQQLSITEYLQMSQQANQLVANNEMGELFKVCAFSRGISFDSWMGFSNGERSHRL